MSEELMNVADVESVFSDISTMIYTAKNEVMMRVIHQLFRCIGI